ncbi:hypothetical protein I4U23_004189 [Adineta vaga]|nr:hypothetical protein I4U23_004189 [Adineta vaga]
MDDILESPSTDDELQQRFDRWSSRFEKDSPFFYYVAENEQKKIIGWCSGRETFECDRIVDNEIYDCEIGHMFVQQEYQNRGIGRELWRIVWNSILERFHPKNLIVWSIDTEQAHRFYRSLGGIPTRTKKIDFGILTRYVWKDLQPYDSTNFMNYK